MVVLIGRVKTSNQFDVYKKGEGMILWRIMSEWQANSKRREFKWWQKTNEICVCLFVWEGGFTLPPLMAMFDYNDCALYSIQIERIYGGRDSS